RSVLPVALLLAPLELPACTRHAASYCTLVSDDVGPRGNVPVRAEVVVSGLETPWGIAFLPDGAMLVTERKGRVRLVTRESGAGLEPTPVATVAVDANAESGLLGIALAPTFASTRQFFLYYTTPKPNGPVNRIERWILSSDARSAQPDKVIVDDIKASP